MANKLNVKGVDPRLGSLFDYFLSHWPGNAKTRHIWASRIKKAASQPGFEFDPALRRFLVYVLVGSRKYSAVASAKSSNYPKSNEIAKLISIVAKLISRKASDTELKEAYSAAWAARSTAASWAGNPRYAAADAAWSAAWAAAATSSAWASDAAAHAASAGGDTSAAWSAGAAATDSAALAAGNTDASRRDFAAALLYFVEQQAQGRKLRRGKSNTFNVDSGKVLITSPQWSRDRDFDLMHELKACNGKWKSRAIMETIPLSDGKVPSPIGFEAWCENPSKSGKWRKLNNLAITDVAMIGIFDSEQYPQDKDKTEHQYWKVVIPMLEKNSTSDRNFTLSINKESVIFELMSDGGYPVWVREGKSKKIDAVVIGFDDDIDAIFEQKMFMDGDIPSKSIVKQSGSSESPNTNLLRKRIQKPARVTKTPTKPKAKDLIAECRALWESYCERPGKMRLRKVEKHCDVMKASKFKTVKDERRRCMNAVRREKKKLGM